MSKITFAAIGVTVLAVIVVAFNRPEPTPSEKLGTAFQDLGNAATGVGDALVDSVKGTQETLQKELRSAADEFADYAADSAQSLSQQAKDLVASWQDTGIISEDGFDFKTAVQALKESSLGDATKEKIVNVLDQIRETPELAAEKLREIRELLEQAG
ncbi:hypothetical protein [Roseovarius sp. EL26]|uniref:hypothetical protein n=1 Tax=Roseovarius sp. EL26 TaxID=2126672 RepID=UPI000EA1E9D5|nr:hypothetical protein [Roseovarius sp. EL26]